MTPSRTLLDTNTVYALMNREPDVMGYVEVYLSAYGKLNFSVFTGYEILKKLKEKAAPARLRAFANLCAASNIFDLTQAVVERASNIHVELRRRGELIEDGDALIAATALVHGMALATNDEERFSRISGLQVENWLRS